jgi:hypothetical protein
MNNPKDMWINELKETGKYDCEKRDSCMPADYLKIIKNERKEIRKNQEIKINPRKYFQKKMSEIKKRETKTDKRIGSPIDIVADVYASHSRKSLKYFIRSNDHEDQKFIKKYVDIDIEDKGSKGEDAENKRIARRHNAERRFPQIVPEWHILVDYIKKEDGAYPSRKTIVGMKSEINAIEKANEIFDDEKVYSVKVLMTRGLHRYKDFSQDRIEKELRSIAKPDHNHKNEMEKRIKEMVRCDQ